MAEEKCGSIVVALYVYWLALSGHYEPWFVWSGFVLSVSIVLFCWVTGITDREGFPVGLLTRAIFYWPWLAFQILKSGLRVTRIILDPNDFADARATRCRARRSG